LRSLLKSEMLQVLYILLYRVVVRLWVLGLFMVLYGSELFKLDVTVLHRMVPRVEVYCFSE
jgi:hypothetical protein